MRESSYDACGQTNGSHNIMSLVHLLLHRKVRVRAITSPAFRVGEELVFVGAKGMAAKPGARVIVTRSLYGPCCCLIGVAWIDELRNGQRDGGYDPKVFYRTAKILPFTRAEQGVERSSTNQ